MFVTEAKYLLLFLGKKCFLFLVGRVGGTEAFSLFQIQPLKSVTRNKFKQATVIKNC